MEPQRHVWYERPNQRHTGVLGSRFASVSRKVHRNPEKSRNNWYITTNDIRLLDGTPPNMQPRRDPTPEPGRSVARKAGILTTAAILAACSSNADPSAYTPELATVVRGPLRISVTEDASIVAAQETKLLNQMEGKNTTVIWLIDEGMRVEQGDVVVRLDASSQTERAADQEIKFEKVKAWLVAETEELAILRKQCDSDFEAATNALMFAEMDLKKFFGELLESGEREMGEQEQAIKQEIAEIQLAEAELELAKDKYEWSKILQAEDFITATELERDKLSYEEKSNRLDVARNKLEILRSFTHQKSSLQLNQNLVDARLALERTISKNQSQISRAEAALRGGARELALASERLENLKSQIEHSVVRAPHDGLVVYGSEGGGMFGFGKKNYVQEGGSVREGQNLITLPDTSHMKAELSISEALINDVQVGQRVIVTVDKLSQPMSGVVERRAPLPSPAAFLGNPDLKLYRTWVDILSENEDEALLPGQSAQVEIVIDVLQDVLTIPKRAVRTQGEARYVWVSTGRGPQATLVNLGRRSDTAVEVLSGLVAGDKVFLTTPEDMVPPVFAQAPRRELQSEESESPRAAFLAVLAELRPDLHELLLEDAGNWTDTEFVSQFAAHPRIQAAYDRLIGK